MKLLSLYIYFKIMRNVSHTIKKDGNFLFLFLQFKLVQSWVIFAVAVYFFQLIFFCEWERGKNEINIEKNVKEVEKF